MSLISFIFFSFFKTTIETSKTIAKIKKAIKTLKQLEILVVERGITNISKTSTDLSDFKIEDGKCYRGSDYTFSGTAVYKTKAFLNMSIEKKPLLPLFLKWSQIHELSAKPLCGKWFDVGTIERLNQVNSYIQNLN